MRTAELFYERATDRHAFAGRTRTRDDEARRGRYDQRGNLRDETIADGEERVHAGRFGDGQVAPQHADREAAQQRHREYREARDGVAAYEAHRAVEGSVELGFFQKGIAPRTRFFGVDRAESQFGVDGGLTSG